MLEVKYYLDWSEEETQNVNCTRAKLKIFYLQKLAPFTNSIGFANAAGLVDM